MDEDISQNEIGEAPDANDPAAPEPEGGEPEANLVEARIAELTGQLESLRAETDRQLESLRADKAAQLAAYGELARTLPGLVPELVGGASLEAIQGSLATAREAYNRIAANLTIPESGEKRFGPLPGAGGGARSGPRPGEDQPAKLASERGVNLIYQAIAGGKNGNLAR